MDFVVEQEIFDRLPTACFGVVAAAGIDNTLASARIDTLLEEGIAAASARFAGKKVKEEADILPYREAFRTLGINPNKYMCSIEALFTRIAKGKGMPHINPVVDLGNAISLKYTLPIGAHDLREAGEGITVRLSREGDTFQPFGTDTLERPEPGEAVYAVGSQIRTRRWTWRQSEQGKIVADTTSVFYPIDGFTDHNLPAVLAARNELAACLEEVYGCTCIVGLVDASHPKMALL